MVGDLWQETILSNYKGFLVQLICLREREGERERERGRERERERERERKRGGKEGLNIC